MRSSQRHRGKAKAATALSALSILTFLAMVLLAPLAAAEPSSATLVRLHPDLPDTLAGAEITRLGLVSADQQAGRLWFNAALWGGFVANLELVTETGSWWRLERSLSRPQWFHLQERTADIMAGRPPGSLAFRLDIPPAVQPDTLAGPPLWPEVPVPPEQFQVSAKRRRVPGYPQLAGEWLILAGLGYQRNVSSYREFFTGMGMISIGFAHPVNEWLAPLLTVEVGFGDLPRDFEEVAGDGRAQTFSFGLGLLGNAQLGRTTRWYAGCSGGYFLRSLQWGGYFQDPQGGTVPVTYIEEMGDWGFTLRTGLMFQKAHVSQPRFLDIGVSLAVCPAPGWRFSNDEVEFVGGDQDLWFAVTVKLWDGL